jgi:hypothetical protein
MRAAIIVILTLSGATTPALANEAFVSQMGAARQIAGSIQPTMRDAVSAARIASPIRLTALAAPTSTTPTQNSNVSFVAQTGTNNLATVAQTGGNNMSFVVQNGTGNRAIVSQRH